MKTVFEMIIDGDIPSVKLYEDDVCLVILDINPIQKGHALVISKKPYPRFTESPCQELSHMMEVAKKVDLKMREALKAEGTNIMINNDIISSGIITASSSTNTAISYCINSTIIGSINW